MSNFNECIGRLNLNRMWTRLFIVRFSNYGNIYQLLSKCGIEFIWWKKDSRDRKLFKFILLFFSVSLNCTIHFQTGIMTFKSVFLCKIPKCAVLKIAHVEKWCRKHSSNDIFQIKNRIEVKPFSWIVLYVTMWQKGLFERVQSRSLNGHSLCLESEHVHIRLYLVWKFNLQKEHCCGQGHTKPWDYYNFSK